MAAKWTQAHLDRLPFADKGQIIHRDPEVKGLLLVVGKRTKTFSYQRDLWRGPAQARVYVRTIRMAVRDAEGLPIAALKQARIQAGVILDQINRGIDPLRPNEAPSGDLTLGMAWDEYETELKRKKRATGTIAVHKYLKDKLGALKDRNLATITVQDISKLHQIVTDGGNPYVANDVAAAIRTVYVHAQLNHAGLPPTPPLTRDQRARLFNDEVPRSTLLRAEDFPRFWAQTEEFSPMMRAYWRMLLLSGARRRTLSNLRRADVDLKGSLVRFRTDKTGAYWMPLSDEMAAIIEGILKGRDSDYVFLSAIDDSKPLQEPRRDKLGVSPHDLRRTYKTVLCADCEISQTHEHALLNHADEGMDKVYRNREVICRSERLREVQQRITARAMALVAATSKGAELQPSPAQPTLPDPNRSPLPTG